MKSHEVATVNRLLAEALDGSLSRRELLKRAGALGLSAAAIAALTTAAGPTAAGAQTSIELSFDAGATGGGGGKPNAAAIDYCYVVNGGSQFELARMVDARLVTLSADLQTFVGELAETWEIAGTTARFNLRQNAKWHDGTPLTAKDVVFTINTLTDPNTGSRWGTSFASVKGYAEAQASAGTPTAAPTSLVGVTAPDDYTVVLELTQPDSGLLPGFMFINILPEHIFRDAPRATLCEQPNWTSGRIGAGPYKFVRLVEGERLELEAFDDYFLGRPKIDKVNLLFFASFETSLAAFQQGSSLAAPLTVLNLELVNSLEFAEVQTTPAGVGAIWINSKLPEFADKRVRQAISYAIDRKTITDNLFQGYADPVASEIPYLAWTQAPDLNPYAFDPAKAQALLTEAGWDAAKTFTLWYYYPDQLTASVMEAVAQYLAEVGVKVELRLDDGSGVWTKEIDEGTWALTYGSFGAQPAPANLSVIWGCQAAATYAYCNPQFDELMEKALRTYDQNEQGQYYQQAIKLLNDELPWVWLFNRKNLIAVNKTKLNTGTTPVWGPGHIMYRNNVETWTVTG